MVTEIIGIPSVPANGREGNAISHALSTPENGWSVHPSQIVSLYDLMRRFGADVFMDFAGILTLIQAGLGQVDDDVRELLSDKANKLKVEFRKMGLDASKATSQKMLNLLERECSFEQLSPIAEELGGRMIDETAARYFFCLNGLEHARYKRPREGWEPVLKRFPVVGSDIEEAYRCWACSRYTAAVFHSLQIAEAGIIELGTFIGVTDPLSNWKKVTDELKRILDTNYKTLPPPVQQARPFLEQIHGTIESLKNAWRNKVNHFGGRLTVMTGEEFHPHVSEEILIATRALMRRLAEGLPANHV